MRVALARTWSAQDVADSYALWWRDAGLHSATSAEPHGWLDAPAALAEAPLVDNASPRERVAKQQAPLAPANVAPIRTASSVAYMPGDLAAFHAWVAQDSAQPEAAWTGPLFLPPLQTEARLLVLCDMPDDGAETPPLPFAGATASLVTAMLAAMGLTTDEAAFAPLAVRRPPGGLLDEAVMKKLATRMRHYLGLARPKAALILGDRTSRALLAAQTALAHGLLPEINHEGGTLPVAALAGPELLMRRPLAKAASWQTLRLLSGAMNR